mmetsp:Transcript_76975/g.249397  ORF Transcript_76975/g.249397 Transcript_76975/m.249397 type:complete len:809 (-) Transcript_76975:45-2471(-)
MSTAKSSLAASWRAGGPLRDLQGRHRIQRTERCPHRPPGPPRAPGPEFQEACQDGPSPRPNPATHRHQRTPTTRHHRSLVTPRAPSHGPRPHPPPLLPPPHQQQQQQPQNLQQPQPPKHLQQPRQPRDHQRQQDPSDELSRGMLPLRCRIKSAAQEARGEDDWASIFCPKDGSRSSNMSISFDAFLHICQKVLNLPDSEARLWGLFGSVGSSRSGEVSAVSGGIARSHQPHWAPLHRPHRVPVDKLVAYLSASEQAGDVESAVARPAHAEKTSCLIVDVEHHALDGSFHSKFSVEQYEQMAKTFKTSLEEHLAECGITCEVRLNPGPPKGFAPFHNIQGWYHHARMAKYREQTRWVEKPAKKLQYPRLGSFEVSIRLPQHTPASRAAGAWRGLPRTFEVFSKMKRKTMPKKVEDLARRLARQLECCRDGQEGAAQQLLTAFRPAPPDPPQEDAGDAACDQEHRCRRPERNPPMWMSLHPRGSPPVSVVPGRRATRTTAAGKAQPMPMLQARAGRVSPEMIEKDHSGKIDWFEFRQMCRRVLKIDGEDVHLFAIFQSIDADGSGEVAIEELVSFISDPVDRMRTRLRAAAEERSPGNWAKLFEEQDEDGSGELDYTEFRAMCRGVLRVLDNDYSLRAVFKHVDSSGDGEITIEELVGFIEQGSHLEQNEQLARQHQREHSQEDAARAPVETQDCGGGSLERMKSRLKGAAYTLGGEDWPTLFREHHTDRMGQMDWPEYRMLCQRVLRLPDESEHLKLVFSHLDADGSGLVPIEDLIAFVAPGAVSVEVSMELLGQANWIQRQCRAHSAR